jgi:hypothetical protein
MQASLPRDLVPLGATNLLMIISTSCAIFLAVGQAVFENRLISNLGQVLDKGAVEDIMAAGVTGLRKAVDSRDSAAVLREYSHSITQVFVSTRVAFRSSLLTELKYIAAAAPAISFLLVAFCKWTTLQKPENKKIVEKDEV